MIDLNKLMEDNYQNAKARGYDVNNIFTDLKDAAGEIVEATAAWNTYRHDLFSQNREQEMKDFQLEVADVIMCMMTISHVMGWDIEDILYKCMIKNRNKIKE